MAAAEMQSEGIMMDLNRPFGLMFLLWYSAGFTQQFPCILDSFLQK